MRKTALFALLFVAVPFVSGEEVPAAKVTPEAIQEIQVQINALQRRLNALMEQAEASRPVTIASAESPAGGIAQPAAESSPQAAQVPGQRQTDKGLYQGLAAGPPGQRYGRGIFGEAVKIGGYGSFRYEANNIDLGPRIGGLPPIQRGVNGFDFRRFVVTLDATPSERLRVYSEIEFERFNQIEIERTAIPENRGLQNRAGTRFIEEVEGQGGSEIAVEQAWAQYDFGKPLGLRMGVILPPVGRFNILHDDDYWDLPRRPLVDRGGPVLPVKSAWRELGAGLVGNIPLGQGYLDYQIYGMGGVKMDFALEKVVSLRQGRELLEIEPELAFASGPFNGTNPTDAFSWRVAYSPKLGNEIAFSGYHGRYTPSFLKVDSSINTVGLDGKLTWKRFEMEGEFLYTDFGRLEAVLQDVAAQAVDSAAETSSAETAALESEVAAGFAGPFTNQRFGYWVDLKYRFWPRFLSGTFLGRGFENPQLIPIVRLERIWFNDFIRQFTFAGGRVTNLQKENMEQQRISLGLTYRPTVSVAFTAAYERSQRIQGSTLIFPRVLGLGRVPDKSFDALLLGVAFGF